MPGITIDRLSARPIFDQLADQLRAMILDGAIPADRKMPSEQSLVDELGVSVSTVARVMAQLRAEGLVVFVPGRGAFTAQADVIAKIKRGREK